MHEPLANAFMATAVHMFEGGHERIEAIDIKADQDLADINLMVCQAVARLDSGSGVLILTDVLGGTPSNCCHCLADQDKVGIIAGASLPLFLRAITYRNNDLETVIEKALSGGKNGVVRVALPD